MKMSLKTPKLTVVGAGPGDEELITLKAIKAIESADVILYDALINESLLKYASENELDNCVLINENKSVVEVTNGNIFIIKDKIIK